MSSSGISWAICKSAPCSRQVTTPVPHHSVFLQAGCPSCHPTNVKALKVKKMSIWSLTYQQSVFKCYHSDKHLSVFPARWRPKSTGIDMEQNYIIVAICIKPKLDVKCVKCKKVRWSWRSVSAELLTILKLQFKINKLRWSSVLSQS